MGGVHRPRLQQAAAARSGEAAHKVYKPAKIKSLLFAACTLAATCCGGHPACICIASFPDLHLQYVKIL